MIKRIWKTCNIITFAGLLSAVAGIALCFSNKISLAVICLIISGICDGFDGPFAKKINKGPTEYGAELDSLADIISFGILPVCICLGLGFNGIGNVIIYSLFVVCGVTRLAYYNVNSKEDDCFTGIPITASCIIIPITYILTKSEIVYMGLLALLSFSYVSEFNIKKPSLIEKILLSITGFLVVALVFFSNR